MLHPPPDVVDEFDCFISSAITIGSSIIPWFLLVSYFESSLTLNSTVFSSIETSLVISIY